MVVHSLAAVDSPVAADSPVAVGKRPDQFAADSLLLDMVVVCPP